VVAQFIFEQSATGATTESILRQVEAISRLHDKYGLSNPTATAAARAVLEREFAIEVPRSWKAPEKEMFVMLPADIRAAISRREKQRETEVRRLQNSIAEEKKRLQAAGASTQAADNERTTEMARKDDKGWNDSVQGGEAPKFDRSKDYTPFKKGSDILDRVDKASGQDGGFSGKLPNE
jgi:hypothetical protein